MGWISRKRETTDLKSQVSALPYLSQASLSKDTNWGVSETVELDMGLGTGASQVEKSSVLLELKKKKKASAINL